MIDWTPIEIGFGFAAALLATGCSLLFVEAFPPELEEKNKQVVAQLFSQLHQEVNSLHQRFGTVVAEKERAAFERSLRELAGHAKVYSDWSQLGDKRRAAVKSLAVTICFIGMGFGTLLVFVGLLEVSSVSIVGVLLGGLVGVFSVLFALDAGSAMLTVEALIRRKYDRHTKGEDLIEPQDMLPPGATRPEYEEYPRVG